MTTPIRSLLRDLVAPGALLPEAASASWAVEGRAPAAVLAPSSEEEVGRILERASQEGWKVLPAGFGKWLAGGGPVKADLVVSTQRICELTEYEPADLTFTAGAGLSLSALAEVTRAHGQWLPLDPPGGEEGSLGAAMATGAAGSLRQWFGTPRDHALGLTLVSGDGRVLRWGGRVVKNVAGFDVTRLCIGSWGTLGVITSVSARLFPLPQEDLTLVLGGSTASSLLPQARAMALSSLPLAAIELLAPAGGVQGDPGGPAELVVRVLGSTEEVDAMEQRAVRDLGGGRASGFSRYDRNPLPPSTLSSSHGSSRGGGAGTIRLLRGEASRAFHRRRDSWEEGADLVLRLTALPSLLGTVLRIAEEAASVWKGLPAREPPRMRVSSHVGAGIVRVAVAGIPKDGGGLGEWIETLRGLRGRMEEMGGSLTLSKGPAALVLEVGTWGGGEDDVALMVGLKQQFDPRGILAPGRLVG